MLRGLSQYLALCALLLASACASIRSERLIDEAALAEERGAYAEAAQLLEEAEEYDPSDPEIAERRKIVESRAAIQDVREALRTADFPRARMQIERSLTLERSPSSPAAGRQELLSLQRLVATLEKAYSFRQANASNRPVSTRIVLEEAKRLFPCPWQSIDAKAFDEALRERQFQSQEAWVPRSLLAPPGAMPNRIEMASERVRLAAASEAPETRAGAQYERREVETPNPEHEQIQRSVARREEDLRDVEAEIQRRERDVEKLQDELGFRTPRYGRSSAYPWRRDPYWTVDSLESPDSAGLRDAERRLDRAYDRRDRILYETDTLRDRLDETPATYLSEQIIRHDIPRDVNVQTESWEILDRLRVLEDDRVLFERSAKRIMTFKADEGQELDREAPPPTGLPKEGIEFLEGYLRTRYLERGYKLIEAGRVEDGCERLAVFYHLGADFPNLRNERDAAKGRVLGAALDYEEGN